MTLEQLIITLPQALVAQVKADAERQSVPLDVYLANVLSDALDGSRPDMTEQEVKSRRADEDLRDRLHRRLARAFQTAKDWDDLRFKLAGKGYRARFFLGEFTLFSLHGTRLCPTKEIGFPYQDLAARFGSGFDRQGPARMAPEVLQLPRRAAG